MKPFPALPSRVPIRVDRFGRGGGPVGLLVPAPRGHAVRTHVATLIDTFEIEEDSIELGDDDIIEVIDLRAWRHATDDAVMESVVRPLRSRPR